MDIEELLAIEQIKRVKHSFMRCLDTKEVDRLAECFTEDATMEAASGHFSFSGKDAIVAFLGELLPTFESSHIASQPEIYVASTASAAGMWKLDDVIVRPDSITRGGGFYFDEYRRDGERWLISHTGFIRLYEEIISRVDGSLVSLHAPRWSDVAVPSNPAWRRSPKIVI